MNAWRKGLSALLLAAASLSLGAPAWSAQAATPASPTRQESPRQPVPTATEGPAGVPTLRQRVTDTADLLPASARDAIETKLAALERDKGAQVAVLIVDSTGDDSIEQYATRVFDAWRLGRDNVDDGILLVVAQSDRTLRIEVGYGLEGAVPDVLAARIIREQITPAFRQGDYARGIQAGVDALDTLVRGESLPAPVATSGSGGASLSGVLWSLLGNLPFEVLVLLGLALLATPPWVAACAGALLGYGLTGSLILGGLGGAIGFLASLAFADARKREATSSRISRGGWSGSSRGSRSSGGWSGRSSGGLGGFGGFSGGGGRSGGGGASGRW